MPCVQLDHYAKHCPDPPMPLILAKALYEDALKIRRYREDGPVVSASALTRCPWQTYLERTTDYVEDPLDSRWTLRGTFAHVGLLSYLRGDPNYLVEQPFKTEHYGFPFHFTPDCYDFKHRALYDLKTQREFAVEKKGKQTDDELLQDGYVKDNVVQVNTYARCLDLLGLPVNQIELQYWDGSLRVRRLNVPKASADKMDEFITARGGFIWRMLNNEIPVGEVKQCAKPIPPKGWSPMKSSPIYYMLKEAA